MNRMEAIEVLKTISESSFYVRNHSLLKTLEMREIGVFFSFVFLFFFMSYNLYFNSEDFERGTIIGVVVVCSVQFLNLLVWNYLRAIQDKEIKRGTKKALLSNEATKVFFDGNVPEITNHELYLISLKLDYEIEVAKYDW